MSTLLLRPKLSDGPGSRYVDLKLVAVLKDYPQLAVGVDSFRVYIQDCKTEIDPSLAIQQLETQYIVWGKSQKGYPLADALSAFEQTPNCQYTFRFDAFMLNPNPNDPVRLLDLPPWFNFNPYTFVFTMNKCGE
jgi:hypothetical protein